MTDFTYKQLGWACWVNDEPQRSVEEIAQELAVDPKPIADVAIQRGLRAAYIYSRGKVPPTGQHLTLTKAEQEAEIRHSALWLDGFYACLRAMKEPEGSIDD